MTAAPDLISVRSLAACSSDFAASTLNRCFENYIVRFDLTGEEFERRFRSEDVDPHESSILTIGAAPAAILLVSRRGWTSRIAALGIAPRYRRSGLGGGLLDAAIAAAQKRRDARLVLEVFEQNNAALALYRSAGFTVHRRLLGFEAEAFGSSKFICQPLVELDPAEGAGLIGRLNGPESPWQLQAATISALTRPIRCFSDPHHEHVALVREDDRVRLQALATVPGAPVERTHDFVNSLRKCFPHKDWYAPPIFPTEVFQERFCCPGWRISDLAQFELHHTLDSENEPDRTCT